MSLVQGGPDWLDTERYEVTARGAGAVRASARAGPAARDAAAMLRALLVERMQLQVRIELQERRRAVQSKGRPREGDGPDG